MSIDTDSDLPPPGFFESRERILNSERSYIAAKVEELRRNSRPGLDDDQVSGYRKLGYEKCLEDVLAILRRRVGGA